MARTEKGLGRNSSFRGESNSKGAGGFGPSLKQQLGSSKANQGNAKERLDFSVPLGRHKEDQDPVVTGKSSIVPERVETCCCTDQTMKNGVKMLKEKTRCRPDDFRPESNPIHHSRISTLDLTRQKYQVPAVGLFTMDRFEEI